MAYRSILVPLDGGEPGRRVLDIAHGLASDAGSHLDVFHAQPDSKEAVPLLGEGMSGAMIEEMMELADRDATAKSAVARKIYDDLVGKHNLPVVERGPGSGGVTASWAQETGREDELVARRGRTSDLIVMGRPETDAERPSLMTLHAAIFETGKPVLIIPPSNSENFGKRIAIAWNGSVEASRAAAAAMPFLQKAEQVVIMSFETEKSANRLMPADLARYLSWHGVKTIEETVSPAGRAVGEALLLQCQKEGADMLVMGAYTHSRVIQIILGGVTRHVITASDIPLLMSH